MDNPQRYTELVQRLNAFGYAVEPDGERYLVRSQNDPHDVSVARHLGDLEELADLIQWAAERGGRQPEAPKDFTHP